MGRLFLDHPGGVRVYCCANCDTALTNRSELVSTVSYIHKSHSHEPYSYFTRGLQALPGALSSSIKCK